MSSYDNQAMATSVNDVGVNIGNEKNDDVMKSDVTFDADSTTSSSSKYRIDYSVVMREIGALGKYQFLLVMMAYWVTIPCGINQVASVFLAATPSHRCALPPLDDSSLYPNLTEAQLKNYTLPLDTRTGDYDECKRYNYSLTSCTPGELNCISPYPPIPPKVIPIKCDKGFYYDTSVYTSTVTTEWNLVCDDVIIGSVVTAVFFAGVLLGSLVGGNIADIFGRCPTMLVGQLAMAAIGIGCAFAPNLVGFAALRFTLALFLQAGYIACFVYVMEITGEKWRTMIGINVQAVFAVGYMTLSGFAYAWRDWRDLQLAISFVPLPFVFFWFFLPESPRWLFSKGKVAKGKKISEMMAKRNGNHLSDDVWQRAEKAGQELSVSEDSSNSYSPLELFRRRRMRLITINMMFNWFVNSLVYYGLSLNAGSLAGDDFVNNTLNGVVEFGAYLFVILTMDRFGRRIILCICLLTGGVACLAATVVNQYSENNQDLINLGTAFALIGKMAVSGSYAVIYNYTAELYPTVVRSTAVGLGSMAARVGSIITPFTLQLQYIIPWLTSVRNLLTLRVWIID
uniref:organic cation transporter protein-like n=1 Tax=Ciona intestinalis TaxID=7719 RepID=UPI000EF44D8F|nr:organic cation transporter protein-like [Ciona intestinalis]|eukprot:XP_026695296.1 organic cation transporter protein-like [Ciona intestinalis]